MGLVLVKMRMENYIRRD